MRTPGLCGFGYQGRTQEEVLDLLVADRVELLVDVRLTPLSRRPGLSKTKLSQALHERGVSYLHLRELGNPKDNRAGFADLVGMDGRRARSRYQELLRSPKAQDALETLAELAVWRKVATLCYEADERVCHRSLILDAVAEISRQHQKSLAASIAFG